MMLAVPSRGEDSEAGLTLVEVLLAVAILGIGVVAVVGGMMTSIKTSDIERRTADAQKALRAYAEAVAGDAYAACATSYPAVGFVPVPAEFTPSMSVSYWDTTSSSFGNPCTAATDSGLQKVVLTITATDGRAIEKLSIAKRKP